MKRIELLPTRDYLCNFIINRIPFHGLRMRAYQWLKVRVGKNSTILMSTELNWAADLVIGSNTIINQHCYLDGRGGLVIGDNVNISSHVLIVAGTHDIQDGKDFSGSARQIIIEDYVWLCTRCMILAGVTVGRGAVVAAGSVVTKSVMPYSIVAGTPARKIGERTPDLQYQLRYEASWQ